MDTTKSYKVSAKRTDTGKFWGFGNLKHNPEYDNWRIGMKVTPELKALIEANDGKWINFSLFPIDDDKPRDVAPETQKQLDTLYDEKPKTLNQMLDDEIPF